jgi:hypothetical protein
MKRSIWSAALVSTLACSLLLGANKPVHGQSIADSYRKAAQAYRDAAAKTTDDKKDCYNAWAGYYDCLADQLQSGSTVTCKAPDCKPGE